jgi:hypothetical protein
MDTLEEISSEQDAGAPGDLTPRDGEAPPDDVPAPDLDGDASPGDAAQDGLPDAGGPSDTWPDAPADVGGDAAGDAGPDVGPDMGPDVGMDACGGPGCVEETVPPYIVPSVAGAEMSRGGTTLSCLLPGPLPAVVLTDGTYTLELGFTP